MASDDWIQESLARVEALEEERSKVEAALEDAGDAATIQSLSARLEAIESELGNLVQQLENAADDGGGDDEPATGEFAPAGSDEPDSEAPTGLFTRNDLARMAAEHAQTSAKAAPPARAPAPAAPPAAAAAPAFAAAPPAAPFGATPPAPAFPAPPAASPSFGGGDYAGDLDDEPKKGKGAMIGIIVAVIVLAGVGGFFALSGGDKTEEPASASGPVKVIGGGDVPPDTQGPKTAKGADVDSVTGTQFKEGQRPTGGGTRPAGGGSGSTPTKKKTDDKTKIVNTDDPLAGIN